MNWLGRRKLRYKEQAIVPFEQIRDRARTGDIILFHKTTRNGLLEGLELGVLSPLIFAETSCRSKLFSMARLELRLAGRGASLPARLRCNRAR